MGNDTDTDQGSDADQGQGSDTDQDGNDTVKYRKGSGYRGWRLGNHTGGGGWGYVTGVCRSGLTLLAYADEVSDTSGKVLG